MPVQKKSWNLLKAPCVYIQGAEAKSWIFLYNNEWLNYKTR